MGKKITSGPNDAKNTYYIKKCFKQELFTIKFPKKSPQWTYISISLRSGDMGRQIFAIFKIYINVLEWESRFTLGSMLLKVPIVLKNA